MISPSTAPTTTLSAAIQVAPECRSIPRAVPSRLVARHVSTIIVTMYGGLVIGSRTTRSVTNDGGGGCGKMGQPAKSPDSCESQRPQHSSFRPHKCTEAPRQPRRKHIPERKLSEAMQKPSSFSIASCAHLDRNRRHYLHKLMIGRFLPPFQAHSQSHHLHLSRHPHFSTVHTDTQATT